MDTQTKITKAYIKHKRFYDLGFNLLASATVGVGLYHLFPQTGHGTVSLFASIMSMITLTAGGNPLKRKAKNVINKYIAFKSAYLLDNKQEVNQQPENIKAFVQHSLMGFYLLANYPKRSYIHQFQAGEDEEHKQFEFIERGYFLSRIWQDVKNQPSYLLTLKTVFEQDFKHDGLLGYALAHNEGQMFDFFFHGFKGQLNFTEEDLNYLKKSNTTLNDFQFEVLFLRENYLKLPKEVREFLVSHYEKDTFNTQIKHRVMALEQEIQKNNHQSSILTDVEKAKAQDELLKAQKIIESKSETQENQKVEATIHDTINQIKPACQDFSKITQDKINIILDKALMVSEKSELLEPTQAIEFKSLITTILPKYLKVFSYTQHSVEAEKEVKFLSTLTLMDKYLDSCLKNIELSTHNEFDVVDKFLKNKLSIYDTDETSDTQPTKTLKMKH